ncbi:hypothetical protein ACYPKM_04300 [Pseudomonas aeruginosa]
MNLVRVSAVALSLIACTSFNAWKPGTVDGTTEEAMRQSLRVLMKVERQEDAYNDRFWRSYRILSKHYQDWSNDRRSLIQMAHAVDGMTLPEFHDKAIEIFLYTNALDQIRDLKQEKEYLLNLEEQYKSINGSEKFLHQEKAELISDEIKRSKRSVEFYSTISLYDYMAQFSSPRWGGSEMSRPTKFPQAITIAASSGRKVNSWAISSRNPYSNRGRGRR